MKRFWLFGGEYYYARGGMHDLIDTFDDVDSAVAEGNTKRLRGSIEWWHVFDRATGDIIYATKDQAYGAIDLPDEHLPVKVPY